MIAMWFGAALCTAVHDSTKQRGVPHSKAHTAPVESGPALQDVSAVCVVCKVY